MPSKSEPEARIFYANTRFEQMARRPGGVPREQALAEAQATIDELKSRFADWLDQELLLLSEALAKVENNLTDNAVLEAAYRNCAQLQSVCAAMDYGLVTFVAENLCKIISTLMAGAEYDKDIVDCHINALLLAKSDQYRTMSPEQVPEMASGLRRVVDFAKRNSR